MAREGWEWFSGEPHKLPKQVRFLPPQQIQSASCKLIYFSGTVSRRARRAPRPRRLRAYGMPLKHKIRIDSASVFIFSSLGPVA